MLAIYLLPSFTALQLVSAAMEDCPVTINQYSSCSDDNMEQRLASLEQQVALLTRLSQDIPSTVQPPPSPYMPNHPRDCREVSETQNTRENGLYQITPRGFDTFQAYCYFDDEGDWLLAQRRVDYETRFDRSWVDYKFGFGTHVDINHNYWLGLEQLHALTNQKQYTVRFDITDWDDTTKMAEYTFFEVNDEAHNYQLSYAGYRGSAGDGLGTHHQNAKFSTFDRGDALQCARVHHAGWWYHNCSTANINGHYFESHQNPIHAATNEGIQWDAWKPDWSFRATMMRIKPSF